MPTEEQAINESFIDPQEAKNFNKIVNAFNRSNKDDCRRI